MKTSPIIFVTAWTAAVVIGLSSCGLAEPDYQAYEVEEQAGAGTTDDGGDGTTDSGDPCETALTTFNDSMAATIDGSCAIAGCHADTAQADFAALVAGDNDANRAALADWTGSDVTKLTDWIHADTSTHTGGHGFESSLPEATLSTWHAAELECE